MTHRNRAAVLRSLARMHGVQTSYFNVRGERVRASEETLEALLQALGIDITGEPERNLDGRSRAQPLRTLEPVIVAWDGALSAIDIRHPWNSDCPPEFHVETEDGRTIVLDATRCLSCDAIQDDKHPGDSTWIRFGVNLKLPPGYHQLFCTLGGRTTSSLLISAPFRCYAGDLRQERAWGLFAPLYALRSDTDWGAGSYSELQSLADFAAAEGGQLVGTLPLLPCFYHANSEPSPYLPITRLFWSDFYIDVARIPFIQNCPEALQLLESREFLASVEASRQSQLVDYVEVQRLKRLVLTALWRHAEENDVLRHSVARHVASHPELSCYASFRAASEHFDKPWQEWPEKARGGDQAKTFVHEEAAGYHEFIQWLAATQMNHSVSHTQSRGVGLYLDLPVGVHPNGYDTWQERDSFVSAATTGAPPDSVFTNGQKWGSPPLHPQAIRQSGYDYVRRYLQHHMSVAQILRVDHVMGLHRIFCIPDGFPPDRGTYLRYCPEEMYAVLSLESHRNRTVVIGEDLGTVPHEVRRSMASHGLNRMFVLYYEMDGLAEERVPSIPSNCMASVNTHDMPPFNAMWQGVDIGKHAEVGVLSRDAIPSARRRRTQAKQKLLRFLKTVCPHIGKAEDPHAVLRCVLKWLGHSRARFVMVNLEDLWLETLQQNIPGVADRHPSWRNKAARGLEDLAHDAQVKSGLGALREAIAGDARSGTGGER